MQPMHTSLTSVISLGTLMRTLNASTVVLLGGLIVNAARRFGVPCDVYQVVPSMPMHLPRELATDHDEREVGRGKRLLQLVREQGVEHPRRAREVEPRRSE